MSDPVRDLSRQIRTLRKQRGFSQAELARRAAVGRRVMIELEAGKPTVRLDVLRRVLHVFGATVAIDLPGKALPKLSQAVPKLSPVRSKLSPVSEDDGGNSLKSIAPDLGRASKLSPVGGRGRRRGGVVKLSPDGAAEAAGAGPRKLSPDGDQVDPLSPDGDQVDPLSPDGAGGYHSAKLSRDSERPVVRYGRPVDDDWID